MGAWSHRMVDTITVGTRTGLATDGTPSYTQSTIKGRIGQKRERDDSDGSTINIVTKIVTHDEVDEDAIIWLPGADTSGLDDAVTPSNVQRGRRLSTNEEIWEVTL